jgi:hypothetical protein
MAISLRSLRRISCDNPRIAQHRFHMSIYRKLNRVPPDDLHHFERQRKSSGAAADRDVSDWLPKRKARPYDKLLSTTLSWCETLPAAVRPHELCEGFPRIANGLAAGWGDRDATMRYLDELSTDRRGGRKGFPAVVLEELHSLRAFYEAVHWPRQEAWRRA